MRPGTRLGVDVGKARVGIARSDPHAMLATPVETITRDLSGDTDIGRIIEIVAETSAVEVVVGLPLNLRGEHTPSTDDAEAFGDRIAAALREQGVPVRFVDERLSTVSAQGQLRQAGRKTRQSRAVIDQAAAVVILQHAIDTERSRGSAPGRLAAAGSPERGDER
ncbi:Holliday junction resolvase RuvX [Leucobacter tardus]|uniref:Putative pre-16S rRNA nuclease n=1 Tax=Leucobacter tardus TaxID=501483 RepID=A0A939TNF2_9MICO|nr:Holliday junction resolvase RuvX [Leucobacter tardus]MBO2990149.1 Holliday junction resolvase RuvX [Leucobacter tardus]